jgi:hypothetical protein
LVEMGTERERVGAEEGRCLLDEWRGKRVRVMFHGPPSSGPCPARARAGGMPESRTGNGDELNGGGNTSGMHEVREHVRQRESVAAFALL